jgi:ParB family transcriptional regulator, chromosome partitioning protein
MSSKTPAKIKPRLGRGLSSLISISEVPVHVEVPEAEAPVSAPAPSPAKVEKVETPSPPPTAPIADREGGPAMLPLKDIVPNPHQPRQVFDDNTLAELAASIRSTGLIQPIIVRQVGGQYQLIAGERRLRAAKLAGLVKIPALVRDVDAVTQAQMALIENIQREDLNAIDRALGYRTLIDQLGLTQAELAGRLGEDRSSIANFLRLLDLAEPVKAMVRDGRLSVGHAKLIAGVADILEQERLANLVLLQGLSVRNLERVMKEGPKVAPAKKPESGSAHLQDLEKSIARQLGLRVQVKAAAKKGKGRLVIHYASLDQFDELLGRLGVRSAE